MSCFCTAIKRGQVVDFGDVGSKEGVESEVDRVARKALGPDGVLLTGPKIRISINRGDGTSQVGSLDRLTGEQRVYCIGSDGAKKGRTPKSTSVTFFGED